MVYELFILLNCSILYAKETEVHFCLLNWRLILIFILTTVLYLTKHGSLQTSLMFWYLLFCSKQSKQRFYSKHSWYWRSDGAWTKAQVTFSVILFALRVCTKSLKSDITVPHIKLIECQVSAIIVWYPILTMQQVRREDTAMGSLSFHWW